MQNYGKFTRISFRPKIGLIGRLNSNLISPVSDEIVVEDELFVNAAIVGDVGGVRLQSTIDHLRFALPVKHDLPLNVKF